MRVYDPSALTARLHPLERRAKTAFAAACAQRLLPLFERYARSAGAQDQAMRLAQILSLAWDAASGLAVDVQALDAEAEAMAPSDDDVWSFEMGYGQNAANAVAYAIGTWINDDPQEATWAAQQVYDAADYAVSQHDLKPDELFSYRIGDRAEQDKVDLVSETVQKALTAIEHDLAIVETGPQSWLELRQNAERDGQAWAVSFR